MAITNYVMPPTSHTVTFYNKAFILVVKLRLRATDICPPGSCCQHPVAATGEPCGAPLDPYGLHAMRCTRCAGRRLT